jgi:zinc protease
MKLLKEKIFLVVSAILILSIVLNISSCATNQAASPSTTGKPAEEFKLGKLSSPIPQMQKLRTGTLANGLRYYVLPNATPTSRATLTLAVGAGFLQETDGQLDLAHLIEHMCFRGTKNFPGTSIDEYLQSLGMQNGADNNAYTSSDRTVYEINVPTQTNAAGLKAIPEKALQILNDWTYNVTFNQSDIDSERKAVLNELRDRNGANYRVAEQMYPLLYHDSAYANLMPHFVETRDVAKATTSELKAFYDKWYRPDNMAIIMVGDFDADSLVASLNSIFDAPKASGKLDKPTLELPSPDAGSLEAKVIEDKELPRTRYEIDYKGPPKALGSTVADFKDDLINNLVDYVISTRSSDALLDKNTPFASLGSYQDRSAGLKSNFYDFAAIPKPGNEKEAYTDLVKFIQQLKRYGFTNSETELAKKAILANLQQRSLEQNREESENFRDDMVSNFIKGSYLSDAVWDYQAAEALLPSISSGDMKDWLDAYFDADDITVFASGMDAAAMPDAETLKNEIKVGAKMSIPKPVEKPIPKELMTTTPVPGTITSEKTAAANPKVNVNAVVTPAGAPAATIWKLDNGATVLLQPTANKNDEIIMYALAKGGYTAVPDSEAVSARLANDVWTTSGIGDFSYSDFLKFMQDKQASFGSSIGAYSRSFSGSSTNKDLKLLFELLYLHFTQPRLDDSAVSFTLDQYKTNLEKQDSDPQTYWGNAVQSAIYGNDPHLRPLVVKDLSQFNVDDARSLIKKALNPADYIFVFAGNLDMKLMRTMVTTYLASIPRGPASWDAFPASGPDWPSKGFSRDLYKGQANQSFVFLGYFKAEPYDQARNATARVLTQYLNVVLFQTIREKMGLAYSPSAQVSVTSQYPGGLLALQSPCGSAPAKAEILSKAVQDVIAQVAKGTIDDATFKQAVKMSQKSFETSLQDNSTLAANYAAFQVMANLPYIDYFNQDALYGAVKPGDIQALAADVLTAKPVQVILYPEDYKK